MQGTITDQPKTSPTTHPIAAPGAEAINEAFHAAKDASQDAVFKSIKCGCLLLEQRDSAILSQRGTGYTKFNHSKPEQDKFDGWLELNCPEIPRTTAYRWMEVAGKVFKHLRLGAPLSAQLADTQSAAYELLTEYICGKTMRDCLASAVVEGDDSQRALNGAQKGGSRGEDRKDWPLFVARKFRDISTHLSHWETMNETQRTEAKQIVRNMILGEETKLSGRNEIIKANTVWPEELCRAAKEALNERLR